MTKADAPRFFENAAAFRAWLQRHAATAPELVVGFHKVGSGKPSMRWSESVDEALCFGWIDGVRTRIDDDTYKIRFTPRRPGSIWSSVNIAKAQKLIAEGRMQPTGLKAFEQRQAHKSSVYSYEQKEAAAFAPAELKRFKQHKAAWRYFEAAPPGYRQQLTYWVTNAKRADTRARRLEQLIDACAEGRRLR